jgi:hypothetical protein
MAGARFCKAALPAYCTKADLEFIFYSYNQYVPDYLRSFSKYTLSYPDLHRIWLHISADPSPNIATAMFLNRSTKLFRQLHCTTGSFVQYAG